MIKDASLSPDERWLLRIFILLRAEKGPVTDEAVLAYAARHGLSGLTSNAARGLLSSLSRRGIIQRASAAKAEFEITPRGRKAAADVRTRLSKLMALPKGQHM